jgi:hypothetical protein
MYGSRIYTEEVEEDVEKGGLTLEDIYAEPLMQPACTKTRDLINASSTSDFTTFIPQLSIHIDAN